MSESSETYRRLSPWRVVLALLILAGLAVGGKYGFQWWQDRQLAAGYKPWFAAYVDVTAKPTYAFEQLGATPTRNAVLSFIVSAPSDPCMPSWGAAYTLDEAAAELDVDRRIARLQQQGGSIAISFGGLKNNELAVACKDVNKLAEAYRSVIDRYDVDTIDLDLENDGLSDQEAAKRRAQAIAKLQSNRRTKDKNLAVWVTLPVAPQGLTKAGTDAVAQLLAANVDLAGINVMTMNYGESREEGSTMFEASKTALIQTHRQLGILYERAGIHLNSATLWTKIGATPMIGKNDLPGEVFTLEAAKNLNRFAQSRDIGRMSIWSANRDVACGDNYADVHIVSDSCSGEDQSQNDYATTLSQGFEGSLTANAEVVTKEDPKPAKREPDNPKKSPYQIWKPTGAYLEGTKVVWHHNVYEAKWWTKGDIPDNPVLQSWQTPWKLIGPVLPGEKPIKQPTLPAGTYPKWSGSAEYETDQRVLFKGTPYQAKWWNKGESPAAASSNASTSPWTPLTQKEIKKILESQSQT